MTVKASEMPAPETMAPIKSASVVNAPMHMPQKATAAMLWRLGCMCLKEVQCNMAAQLMYAVKVMKAVSAARLAVLVEIELHLRPCQANTT